MKKVVIGLSGGVDSSVAAALLIEQGYEVQAVYLECYNEPGCRTDLDKRDALKIAIQLKIPFQVLDFRKQYREKVIEYFYHEYQAGRTPNPDIVCNREIKFGIFYDWASAHGFDFVATGHYARIAKKNGQLHIQRGADKGKDQSYFLWQVPQDHLKHILFPLGAMKKTQVRAKARELKLETAVKPDSMGICFIGEVNVSELLKSRLGENPGEVEWRGEVVGRHRGLWFYTIGSRGGWEVSPKKQGALTPPLYVIAKDKERNRLIVGERVETQQSEFKVVKAIFPQEREELWVRIRNLGDLHKIQTFDGKRVVTSEAIFGVAEGQSAVFYDKDGLIVGGGIID